MQELSAVPVRQSLGHVTDSTPAWRVLRATEPRDHAKQE